VRGKHRPIDDVLKAARTVEIRTGASGDILVRKELNWPGNCEREVIDLMRVLRDDGLLDGPDPMFGDYRFMGVDGQRLTPAGLRMLGELPQPPGERKPWWRPVGRWWATVLAGVASGLVVIILAAVLKHWVPGLHLP
jgi:hypothetical protein